MPRGKPLHVIAVLAVRLVVENHAQIVFRRDGHAARHDGQLARLVFDGIVARHVFALGVAQFGVLCFVLLFAHVRDAAAYTDAVDLVARRRFRRAVRGVLQLRSVIDLPVRCRRDGQLHGLNGQLPVLNHERHLFEVRIRVPEVRRLQLHVVAARVRSLDRRVAAEGEVVCRVQRVADVRHVVPRHGLFRSIVLRVPAVLRDGHHHFFRYGSHRQPAGLGLDFVVVGLRVRVQFIREAVVAPANVRLAARHVVACAFAFREAVARHRHCAVGQRCSVIDLVVCRACQRHVAFADLKRSVHNHEDYLREVRVRVLEVRRLQLHVVTARVRSLDRRIAAEGEVVFRVQRVADVRHVVPRHGLFRSVVLRVPPVLRDRHRHRVRAHNFQRARLVGNCVVRRHVRSLRVHDLRIRRLQLVLIATHVRLASADRHSLDRVPRGKPRHVIAILAVRLVVENHAQIVSRRDGHRPRRDGQLAIRHHKLHIREIQADVLKLTFHQPPGLITSSSACCFRRAAEGEICRLI